jgi:hypothetical protein
VFKTKKLSECLTKWESEYGHVKSFYTKSTFVVGNDSFIWLYFTDDINDVCFITPEVCSRTISHNNSATTSDFNTTKSFSGIYQSIKQLHIRNPLTSGILLYLPDLSDKHLKCLDNLMSYRTSKYNIPIVVYSDSHLEIPQKYRVKFIKINAIPKMDPGVWGLANKYSFWAFIEGIKIAKELNWKYFFGYEWDCKVGWDDWYDVIWQEHLAWPYDPIITGTPVVKCPPISSGNILMGMSEYVYKYASECKLTMLVENTGDFSVYTNGALTFYNTNELLKYFSSELYFDDKNKSDHVDQVGAWDYSLGVRIMKHLKENSFKRVGWLPSSYSGCGENFYTMSQREYMLDTKLKMVIHQYKYQ